MEPGIFYKMAQGFRYAIECRDEGAQEIINYLLVLLRPHSQVERFEMLLSNEFEPHHDLYDNIIKD